MQGIRSQGNDYSSWDYFLKNQDTTTFSVRQQTENMNFDISLNQVIVLLQIPLASFTDCGQQIVMSFFVNTFAIKVAPRYGEKMNTKANIKENVWPQKRSQKGNRK